jgi:tetratricopeptide (TPR) repeat protein
MQSRSSAAIAIAIGSVALFVGGAGGYLLGSGSGSPAQSEDRAPRAQDRNPAAHQSGRTAAAPNLAGTAAPVSAEVQAATAPTETTPGPLRTALEAHLTPNVLPDGPVDPAVVGLIGELTQLLRSGALEGHFIALGSEPELAGFLLEQYLRIQQPEQAFALLSRAPVLGNEAWGRVGQALSESGQKVRAADAFAQALRSSPGFEGTGFLSFDWPLVGYLQSLGELEPAMALALIEPRLAAAEGAAPEMRLEIAGLLERAGRSEEARAAALALLEGDSLHQSMRLLARLDPERAEQELRQRLGQGQDSDLEVQLFELLAKSARQEEALALLETRLGGEGDPDALILAAARELSPEQLEGRLDGWLSRASNPLNVRQQLGELALQNGDIEGAAEHYLTSWDHGSSNGWLPFLPDDVMRLDPTRVRSALDRASVGAGRNDEVWGDIADHYWRLGDKERAYQAWNTAKELDPSDSEWTNKIQNYTNGVDPLNGQSGSSVVFSGLGSGTQVLQSLGYAAGH